MAERLEPAAETALVERARSDPTAFQELYRHYLPRVYGYVGARLAERVDAEDVVASTFLKAFERLYQFRHRGDGSFAAWLLRIAYHELIDHYRRQQRRDNAEPLDNHHERIDGTEPLDNVLIRSEQAARVRLVLASLPPRRQEVVALRFFAGLRNHEIATVLGIHERSVASHLCRALDDLQRLLATDDTAKAEEELP